MARHRLVAWALGAFLAASLAHAADTPGATIPPEARNHYDKASIAREEGRLDEAAQLYRAAIDAHPLYLEAHASYLDVLRGLGRLGPAKELYAALLQKYSDPFDLKVFAAVAQGDGAQAALEAVAQENPGHPRLLVELARLQLSGGEPKEAEKLLKKAVRAAPGMLVAHVLLGDAYLLQQRSQHARKAYKAATEIDPGYAPAHLRTAVTWHRQEKSDEALEILDRLLSEDSLPRLVAGHWTRVVVLVELERYAEAMRSLDTILAIKKDDLPATLAKGSLVLLEGDAMAAVKIFTEAAAKNKRSGAALFALGWAYEKASDAPEIDQAQKTERLTLAADSYDKCTRVDPAARPRDSVGFISLLRGEHKEAEQSFKMARDVDPMFAMATNNLGLVYDMADDRKAAIARYDEVLKKIDRQNVRALVSLGLDFWLQGSPKKAIANLEQATRIDPEDDLAWTFLGDVHWDTGTKSAYKKAIKCYKVAVGINEKNFTAWWHMGKTYEDSLSKDPEADQAYRKALDARPTDPPVDLVFRLALVNEDDRLDRLEDALHFYKLYVDLGGTEEWVPERIKELEELLAGN